MRYGALVPALLCGVLAGCTEPQTVRPTSLFERLRNPGLGKDVVQLDVALVERPVGDPFLNKEIWRNTDEQVVPLGEQKAAVDDNGFRVAQIVGMPPDRLQALLTSERSCINPRRRLLPPGRAVCQLLGPTLRHAEFQVKENGQTTEITLDQVQFVLEVVPTLTSDGRTRLRFAPQAHYGESVREMRVADDGSDWTLRLVKPKKTFPAVSWEATLGADEFLLIGAAYDQPQSLAFQAFVQDDGPEPVQRLLVMRVNRSLNDTATLEDMARAGQCTPLAQQATESAIRAHAP